MKDTRLFFFTFITALSLLLAPLASQEQVEKVRADDYTTYIHPGPSVSHTASSIAQFLGNLPLDIFLFINTPRVTKQQAITNSHYCCGAEAIPIFLFYRKILI